MLQKYRKREKTRSRRLKTRSFSKENDHGRSRTITDDHDRSRPIVVFFGGGGVEGRLGLTLRTLTGRPFSFYHTRKGTIARDRRDRP